MDQNGLRLALLRQTLPPLAGTWKLYTTHGGLVATSARPSGLFKGSQCSPFSGGPRLSRPHWMSSRFLLSPMPEDQPLPSHLYKCEGWRTSSARDFPHNRAGPAARSAWVRRSRAFVRSRCHPRVSDCRVRSRGRNRKAYRPRSGRCRGQRAHRPVPQPRSATGLPSHGGSPPRSSRP